MADLEKALKMVLEMVRETNNQIEEFVMQERMEVLDKKYGGVLVGEGRRMLGEFRVGVVEKESVVEGDMYMFSDMVFFVEGVEKGEQTKFMLD